MKALRITLCILGLLAILLPNPALAQAETIKLEATYPRVESAPPQPTFEFIVTLTYQGAQVLTFDLRLTAPTGWSTYITPDKETTRVSVVKFEPASPKVIRVFAIPPEPVPLPGDYRITLEASSGVVKGSLELTAVILPTYSLDIISSPNRYNYQATPGKDNKFSMSLKNIGSGTLKDIILSATAPADWSVTFEPERVTSLTPGNSGSVEFNIKPSAKAEYDDYYQITLIAETGQVRKTMSISVFLKRPERAWLWAGVAVVAVVVVAFVFIFMRLNRSQ
ncbi:MAG: NEW3 domain-containing protein [Chloroflexota bacterium]